MSTLFSLDKVEQKVKGGLRNRTSYVINIQGIR